MRVHLVNPSHVSFGVGVITPRWLYVIAAATPREFGDPVIVDETLNQIDPSHHQHRRHRRHRHPHRQRAARLRSRPRGARGRRDRHLRRDSRHALSGRGARNRRRACGREGRRRRRLGAGARATRRRGTLQRDLRGRAHRGRRVSSGALGPDAARQLHVGVGADPARLSEALLVLFGLAHRRTEAAAAHDRRRHRRDRRAAPARVPVHCARRRQLLSGAAGRFEDGGAPRRSDDAQQPDRDSQRAIRADGAAREAAGRHRLLHPDHDGSVRRSGLPRRRCVAPGSRARSSASSR